MSADLFSYGGFQAAPGLGTQRDTIENTFYWEQWQHTRRRGAILSSTTVDSGNSANNYVLRPGLLLGMIYSTGEFVHWDPTASDGSQYIAGILDNPGINMKDASGTARDRWRSVMIQGNLKPDRLLVPGQASFGLANSAYEYVAREQLKQLGCVFYEEPLSDSMLTNARFMAGHTLIQAKTADYTCKNYESGTLFTNRGANGAVVFTLPASPKVGVYFDFHVVADQSVRVAAGTADTMILFNDAACDYIEFATASKKIGASVRVMYDGTGWLAKPTTFTDGTLTQTITIVT